MIRHLAADDPQRDRALLAGRRGSRSRRRRSRAGPRRRACPPRTGSPAAARSRTCSGCRPRPRARRSGAARRAAPADDHAPWAARSTYQNADRRPARDPGDRSPDAGDEVQRDHRDPDDEVDAQSALEAPGTPHEIATKALCNTLLQDWCITPPAEHPAIDSEERRLLKSYLPVLVFLGLGSASALAFTTSAGCSAHGGRARQGDALRVRAALRRPARLPLRDQLLPRRDAVHPVRRRGDLPLPGRRAPEGGRAPSCWSRRSSSSRCWRSRSCSCGAGERSSGNKAPEARSGRPTLTQPRPRRAARPPAARARPAARRPRGRRPRAVRRGARAHDDAREGAQLGALERALAGHLRARLLRDRDDVDGHLALRHARASAPRCSARRRARPTC